MTALRRQRLADQLAEKGLDGLLVTKLVNVRYLSGFTGSAGAVLVTLQHAVLATDGRYTEQAAAEAPELSVVSSAGTDWIRAALDGRTRLGVESHDLAWDRVRALGAALPGVELVPVPRLVETQRQRKDPHELAAIRRACAVSSEAFGALLGWLRPGLDELTVARRLEAELVDRGAAAPAFASIVASGPNGARPHHAPERRLLRAGDLVTCDFGAQVDGYASDMTRTVALGEPSAELRAVYDLVRQAEAAGVAAARDGVEVGAVDAACRNVVAGAGRVEQFLHPTGHGLGLEIHEEPILREGSTARLRSRMTVTVEPGVYVTGLGGVRIEDTLLVTDAAPDILTTAPTELLVL